MANFLRILSSDEIKGLAPSAFQSSAYRDRSDKFGHVPTYEAFPILAAIGYHPVGVRRSNTRIIDKREYVKHSIDFVQESEISKFRTVGAEFPIITIQNGHDGSSLWQPSSGIYTVVCSNTARRCDSLNSIGVKHIKNDSFESRVVDSLQFAIEAAQRFYNELQSWKTIVLNTAQVSLYAEGAVKLLQLDARPADIVSPTNRLEQGEYSGERTLAAVYQSVQGRAKRGQYRKPSGRKATEVKSMSRQDHIDTILAEYTAKMAEASNRS